jgi:HK97 family phage major capsid protein
MSGATLVDKEALKKEALELNEEVKTKSAMWRKGELTDAQFSQFMDNAEENNKRIEKQSKNLERAIAWRAASIDEDDGRPLGVKGGDGASLKSLVRSHRVDTVTKALQTYHTVQDYTGRGGKTARRKGDFTLDLGFKMVDRGHEIRPAVDDRELDAIIDELITKAQGVTGLMGEATSGTNTPAGLTPGQYFLGGTAGAVIEPEFIPGIVELRFYPTVIGSLFANMPVSSPIVSYVREASWTNNAAAVPEGATKPTSQNGLQRFTEEIGKIAHLVRTTDEMIADAPYFWALVQRRLTDGVLRKEEIELLAGAGYPGVNGLLSRSTGFTKNTAGLTAIANLVIPTANTPGAGVASDTVATVTPGIQIKGATGVAPTGVQMAEGVLQMLTDIRTTQFFEPDAVILNPANYMTIRIAKDDNGQYLGGSFFGSNYGQPQNQNAVLGAVEEGLTLWSKRTITTPVMPLNLSLVGCFREGGQVLRRSGLEVQATNSHESDFAQNLWAVRAETRLGLLIERPELFELGQFVSG